METHKLFVVLQVCILKAWKLFDLYSYLNLWFKLPLPRIRGFSLFLQTGYKAKTSNAVEAAESCGTTLPDDWSPNQIDWVFPNRRPAADKHSRGKHFHVINFYYQGSADNQYRAAMALIGERNPINKQLSNAGARTWIDVKPLSSLLLSEP